MLDLDVSRRPQRPREWRAVLEAVYNAADGDEQTWLEWKSSVDLRSKSDVAASIAKPIIAFANRDPVQARATVGGIGILVVGLAPGTVGGVQAVDNADLDKLVSTFVGDDGPTWQPHWESYDGRTVLIIEVAAPEAGDPIHAVRRQIEAMTDGQVYVRKRARSVPADHKNLQRLAERYAARHQSEALDIAIVLEAAALSRYVVRDEDAEAYVAAEQDRLLAAMAQTKPKPTLPAAFNDIANLMESMLVPEQRTREQYLHEVAEYVRRLRESWSEAMAKTASHLLLPVTWKAVNRTKRNFRQLEVRLHVAGTADVRRRAETGVPAVGHYLPKPPRAWGPTAIGSGTVRVPSVRPIATPYTPRTRIDRGGSFTMEFVPADLRPLSEVVLDDEHTILVPTSREDPVIATWSATATNVDDRAAGEFEIPFVGAPVNPFVEASRQK